MSKPNFAVFDGIMARLCRASPPRPITLVCQVCGTAVPAERKKEVC